MSHAGPDDEAERHRQAAAATERHHKPGHHHSSHPSSGGAAYDQLERDEATFFVRHRSKLAAGLMIALAIIFFTFVFGFIRF